VQAGTAVVTLPSEEELYHQFFFFFFSILLECMSPVVTTLSGKMTPPDSSTWASLHGSSCQIINKATCSNSQLLGSSTPWQQPSGYQQGPGSNSNSQLWGSSNSSGLRGSSNSVNPRGSSNSASLRGSSHQVINKAPCSNSQLPSSDSRSSRSQDTSRQRKGDTNSLAMMDRSQTTTRYLRGRLTVTATGERHKNESSTRSKSLMPRRKLPTPRLHPHPTSSRRDLRELMWFNGWATLHSLKIMSNLTTTAQQEVPSVPD
jgi:hypothetical protein